MGPTYCPEYLVTVLGRMIQSQQFQKSSIVAKIENIVRNLIFTLIYIFKIKCLEIVS